MSESQYGTVDVREVRLSASEVKRIVLENIQKRSSTPYNFDYVNPIILSDVNGGLIFRFCTVQFTGDTAIESVNLKSFSQIKKKSV